MTEHESEKRADLGALSPELGFSFGFISAEDAEDRLGDKYAARAPELEDLALEIGSVSDLFRKGLPDSTWHGYVDTAKVDITVFEDAPNSHLIQTHYDALLAEARKVPVAQIDDFLEYVNAMLEKFPNLIRKSAQSEATLRKLGVEWRSFNEQTPPYQLPADLVAYWSNGEREVQPVGQDIVVDIAQLPASAHVALKKYHDLYYVGIDEDGVFD